MPVCCRIQLCCDPPAAAEDLSGFLGIPAESAGAVLSSFRLIPFSVVATGAAPGTPRAKAAEVRLRALHRLADLEMRSILADMGHEAGEPEAEG